MILYIIHADMNIFDSIYSILQFQKACYLSINPLKEESMETEKAQYMLPDGSSIEVGGNLIATFEMPSDK